VTPVPDGFFTPLEAHPETSAATVMGRRIFVIGDFMFGE
jgi:hypothetical protein